MTTGTGIAILSLWLPVAAAAYSPHVQSGGTWAMIIVASVGTVLLRFWN